MIFLERRIHRWTCPFNMIVFTYIKNKNDNSEEPVEFLSNIEKNYTYIPLKNGYPRDINDDVINDDTIVEFIHDDERDGEKPCGKRLRHGRTHRQSSDFEGTFAR